MGQSIRKFKQPEIPSLTATYNLYGKISDVNAKILNILLIVYNSA